MKRKRIVAEKEVNEMPVGEVIHTCMAQSIIALAMMKTIDPNDWYEGYMEASGLILDAMKVLGAMLEQHHESLDLIKFEAPLGMGLIKVSVQTLMRNSSDDLPF